MGNNRIMVFLEYLDSRGLLKHSIEDFDYDRVIFEFQKHE